MFTGGGERMTNHEIDKLMKRIALGDMAALEELYRNMSKPVYFYALRLVGDPVAAEDVMQDTFVSVMRSSGTYNAEEKGRAWLFTIAKNKAADIIRKRSDLVSGGEIEDVADRRDFTTQSDNSISVTNLLNQLSKKERDIVTLRLFGDMTLTQVSKELDIPKGTVFWTYSNAVKKLRRYYTGGEKDEK